MLDREATRTVSPRIADIAVIGGGIAGAAACIALGRRGCRPIWLAPETADGDRIGESLAPAATPILASLALDGLAEGSRHRPSNATYSCWGSDRLAERNAIVHLEGPGRVLDRPAFEADLAAAALAAGAERMVSAVVAAEHSDDGRWRLELDQGGTVGPRFVIDASGRSAIVARTQSRRRRADRLVAAHAWLRQTGDEVEPTPATLIEAVADGWWYAALLPDRRLVLSFFSDPDLLPRGLSRDLGMWKAMIAATGYVRQWLDSADFAPDAPPRLASAGTTWLERAAGPGWAAAGDAAAAFDPLSSHGMTTALWSGRQAADAALAALDGDTAPLDRYADAIGTGVGDFLAQRAAIYGMERRFADRPFWQRHAAAGPA